MATHASRTTLTLYGVGQIAPSIKGNLLGTFLLYYYNQVLGLSPGLAGVALAIALVVDAVTDPLLGYISDHTKSKLGRRHPYMYASLIPSAAFYYFLITASFGTSQTALFIQLVVLVTGLRVAWTFYQVPREALGAELSKDYSQRNQLHGINSFFGWIGGAGIAYATQAIFLEGSYDNAAGYQELAYWGTGIIFATSLLFTVGTHKNIPELEQPKAPRPVRMKDIARDIIETLAHRSWLMLFLAGVVFSIYIGLVTGLGIYFNRFLWEWAPIDVAIFAILDLSAAILISLFAGTLASRWDKKQLAVRLFVISIAVGPILLLLRLADVWYGIQILPPNGPKYLSDAIATGYAGADTLYFFEIHALWWIMLIHSMFTAAVGVLAWILVGSMTADVVEDSQRQTGKRSEGLFFAGPNLVQKCISGLGFVIKGSILTAVGFSAAVTEAEKIAAVQNLAAVFALLAIVLPSLALYIFSHYEITRDVHQENLDELGYTGSDGARLGAVDETLDQPIDYEPPEPTPRGNPSPGGGGT